MFIINDYRYKGIVSDSFIKYVIELACLCHLLDENLIDEKMHEELNVQILNSHIGNK